MSTFDVVAAGHICLDIIPPFETGAEPDLGKLLQPGKLLHVGKAVLSTGGAVSNTGIALCKLGGRVAFMTRVGEDAFGRIITDKMAAWGNVEGIARDSEHGSSYSIVIAPPAIDRIFLHHPGCNDFFTGEMLNWEIIGASRIFHLGYPSLMRSLFIDEGKELAHILQSVRKLAVATSLDMALPDANSDAGRMSWKSWLRNVMPHVDFFMPSIEEMLLLWNRAKWEEMRRQGDSIIEAVPVDLYREMANDLIALGCGVVILKAGPRGIYTRTAGEERIRRVSILPTPAHKSWAGRELWSAAFVNESIQSAAGAGDSAAAGILTALLHEKSLEETLQFGNCLGYQNLRALDTVSGVGTLAETEVLLTTLQPGSLAFLDQAWQPTEYRGVLERNQPI
jgi:sugar/nucleoside kinase (ribokinase family)